MKITPKWKRADLSEATCGPHAPTPSPAYPAGVSQLPEQFGRYRIIKLLGHGGMGSVYLAFDPRLNRTVALKVPHGVHSDRPEILQRFLREVRAAATLVHPAICPVYSAGVIEGIPYATMPFFEGRLLAELIQDNLVPPRMAAVLVRKLAQAMQEAHRQGIIHRDLKPSNILIKPDKQPVILDFGLARRGSEDAPLTRLGQPLGTPAYMAPEQVSGDGEAIGPGCDVYSLGVILYELLTGQPPFQGPPMAVLAQVLTKRPVAPSVLRPGLDPALEAICLKAMAKEVKERYASMEELVAELTAYLRMDLGSTPAPVLRERNVSPASDSRTPAPGVETQFLGQALPGVPDSAVASWVAPQQTAGLHQAVIGMAGYMSS